MSSRGGEVFFGAGAGGQGRGSAGSGPLAPLPSGGFPGVGVGETRPPMDWKETRDAHVFMMDVVPVPGLTKEQVAVELVDGRILRVRARRQAQAGLGRRRR